MAPEIMKHNGEEEYTEKVKALHQQIVPSAFSQMSDICLGGLFLIWNVFV